MAKDIAGQQFENVAFIDGNDRIIVDLSALPSDHNLIIKGVGRFGSVQFQEPGSKQTNAPDVVSSSVDKRALQIGDVLGTDFILPENLGRLNGWLIYNITDAGMPQALEPIENAPKSFVTWTTCANHINKTLKKQGHTKARLWTEADGTAIFNNIVKGGLNGKAQLDISNHGMKSFDPNYSFSSRYWEGTMCKDFPGKAMVFYIGFGISLKEQNGSARVRGVQDVSELSL